MTSARDLTARLADLLRREHAALGEFLVALAAFDQKRLWLDLGHSSLFYFLHRELGLSKGAAFYRKTAAELIQKYPEVVEPLRDGRLCLTSVVEVSKVITAENRHEVLPRFFRLSKREAKAVSAALKPDEAPPHREVVTTVRTPVAAPPRSDLSVRPDELLASKLDPAPAAPACPAHPPPAETAPLTADLSRLHLTVSRRFLEKLEAARAALSHSHPGAGAPEVLDAGLDLILERQAKRRGLVERPRREAPPAKPEHVPAHVKRAVWGRDGGRCQWPVDGGGVCGSTYQLELDHVLPRGRGGPSTVDNMRVTCAVHNDLAARRVYGDAWMDRFSGERAGGDDHSPASAGP